MTTQGEIEIPTPSGLRRALGDRKKTVFGVIAAFLALGLGLNMFTPPVYRATVRVEFPPDADRSPWSTQQPPGTNFQSENVALFTSAELITNRVLLGRLAGDLSRSEPERLARTQAAEHGRNHWLRVPIARAADAGKGSVQYDPVALGARVDRLTKKISVQPVADTRLVDIRVEDNDPEMARETADHLASMFVAWQKQRSAASDSTGISFVTAEIARVKDRIENTSADLAKIGPRTTYERVRTVHRSGRVGPDPDLVKAQADLAEALQTYRDEHPRVRELRSQIAALRARPRSGSDVTVDYDLRPVTRVVSSPRQAVLENDLAVDEALYTRLQSRANELALVGQVMMPAVAIIQPATLDPEPVWPRPLLNIAVCLLAGTFVAVGIALIQGSLSRTIRSAMDAERLAGVPVLAILPKRA